MRVKTGIRIGQPTKKGDAMGGGGFAKPRLGDRARDIITGFQGIIIAKTTWLNGCARLAIKPETLGKDGSTIEEEWFDEPQVEFVEEVHSPAYFRDATGEPLLAAAPGGPRSDPSQKIGG